MAADLFGDVTRGPRRVGSRRWYTLPLSILTHGAVLVAVLVIPIVASDDALPAVRRALLFEDIDITPVIPPPPMPRAMRPRATPAPPVSTAPAPLEAPSSITPEPAASDVGDLIESAGDPRGVPGGLFVAGGDPPPPPPIVSPLPQGPMRVGGRISPPRRIVNVMPAYPAIAQANKIEGRVVIDAIIGPNGDVQSARVIRSVPLLDMAALAAVRQWKYTPSLLNGVPVSVILTVSVDFTLTR